MANQWSLFVYVHEERLKLFVCKFLAALAFFFSAVKSRAAKGSPYFISQTKGSDTFVFPLLNNFRFISPLSVYQSVTLLAGLSSPRSNDGVRGLKRFRLKNAF